MAKTFTPISHRGRLHGERDGIPGNTLVAFGQLLVKYPEIEVETDVRLTEGDLLYVGHDNLLQNSTTGTGMANKLRAEDMPGLKAKIGGKATDHRVPVLEEVLQLFNGRGTLHIELKYGPGDPPGLLGHVLRALSSFPEQAFTLSSFNHRALLRVPEHVAVGVLTNTMPPDPLTYLKQFDAGGKRRMGMVAFHPDIWNLTDDALDAIKGAGISVNAYTVPPEMFQWCAENQVNPITDFPVAAFDFLDSLQG